ncbi:VanZ family protein [Paenibacillus sp. TRM 82003]|uniref:VanZ family protein n=1 Tax=Kineococcus sp. TRM81007 TaxID=2925831 RepID=UPI001F59256A|nr:VanZ family protein [Kineococcus sp. TRM81007]MCI3919398.1 VanZ family protein [Paenibacillus sp. TRM 82003]MCI2237794.1 VanZ family protein [Kineococcus sp. TRM81007]MCI2237904.1 VanZ family protein [Kineococcus sp. TRM81007]MCI2237907.1 VanZ family protein [Kineococcus sp. TRM81007]MCI2239118.1 VanZ family protein [Kineococcus sp. TRM81007]
MLSTFLITHRWITPALLLVYIVIGPVIGAWLVRRPRLAWALTALSLLPLAALTLVPVDRDLSVGCAVQWDWPTPARVESFANVVLFIAPVLLAGVATRRWVLAAVVGSALSAGIEVLQALVPGLGRSCDTGDWLANTMGALVGGLLAWGALALARWRRPAERAARLH